MEAMLNGPSGQMALGTATVTLGRAPDNTIILNDVKASGHHTEVRPTAQGYIIVDLGSTNGTFVNGMQLTPQVPQELKSFDVIRIGDVSYTYQVSGASRVEPTVYANPPQGSLPGYQPTVAASPPTVYGGGSYPPPPQQDYQVYEPAPPPMPYAPIPAQGAYIPQPPPAYGQPQMGASAYPSYMPPPQGVPAYSGAPVAPAQPARQNRRNLYIGGAVAVALIVGIILYVVLAAASPSKTLGVFCDGMNKHDYQTAYDTLSTDVKSQGSEASFAQSFSNVTGCSYSNVQQSGSTATADVTLTGASGISRTFKTTLITENGAWKISDMR